MAYIVLDMEQMIPLQSISDDELLRRLAELLRESRRVEADLVAHIAELCCGRSYVAERRQRARFTGPPVPGLNIISAASGCSAGRRLRHQSA